MKSVISMSTGSVFLKTNKHIFLCVFILFSFCLQSRAANYYWVGGTGNWSDWAKHWATTSGGSTFHAQEPTPFDNVYFDSKSFPNSGNNIVWMDTTILTCLNMVWTGVTNMPSIRSTGYSRSSILKIYGSLKLIKGMSWQYGGSLYFEATSGGKTITTADHSFANGFLLNNNVYFNGLAGNWTLYDTLKTRNIYLNNGVINTNDQVISCESFISKSGNTRGLNLGRSRVHCSNSWEVNAFAFSLKSDSSLILVRKLFMGDSNLVYNDVTIPNEYNGISSFFSSNNIFRNVIFDNEVAFSGNMNSFSKLSCLNYTNIRGKNSYKTLLFDNPGQKNILDTGSIQTISAKFIANGNCDQPIILRSNIEGKQGIIKMSSGSVSANYLFMQDIKAVGGIIFTAMNSANLGNVSGWNIQTPPSRNLFWVGGSGNWTDRNHWSLSSGGPGGNCASTPFDNIFFDANSFQSADTIFMDAQIAFCKDMDWTGAKHTPCLLGISASFISPEMHIHGSIKLIKNMNWAYTGITSFHGNNSGHAITSAGNFLNKVVINAKGGTYYLMDTLNSSDIIHHQGSLHTRGQIINCKKISSISGMKRTLILGKSIVNCAFEWEAHADSLLLLADSSLIIAQNLWGGKNLVYNDAILSYKLSSNSCKFHNVSMTLNPGLVKNTLSQDNTFNKLTCLNSIAIYGNNTYDTLIFNNPGYTVSLQAGNTQTIKKEFIAKGNCGGLISLESTISGSISTIFKSTTPSQTEYLMISDIKATGGALFAAANSLDAGNATGWQIINPPSKNLYWVGGKGNWSDFNHWASSSGGPGSSCIPSPFDNVFFDAKSFKQAGDTVFLDSPTAFCNNMNWTGSANTPCFTEAYNLYPLLKILGSLSLVNKMKWKLSSTTAFLSQNKGSFIKSAGQTFHGDIYFEGKGGEWNLMDSLTSVKQVFINLGTLRSRSQKFSCNSFNAGSNYLNGGVPLKRSIMLGKSKVYCSGWSVLSDSLSLFADSSTIFMKTFYGDQNLQYNDVIKQVSGNADPFFSINNSFHNVRFLGEAKFDPLCNSNTFNKLQCNRMIGIEGDNTMDTLFFDNPGEYVYLGPGSTQTIHSQLLETSSPGFPISFETTQNGSQAEFSMQPGDTVCWNYVYLRDIKATGGAVFFAGINSSNISNNAGWIWTNCQPLDINDLDNSTQNSISIFPNPATDFIQVHSSDDPIKRIIICDISGRILLHRELNNMNDYSLDLTEFTNGFYLMKIESGDKIFLKKILIGK
jgi:hypothetical protein